MKVRYTYQHSSITCHFADETSSRSSTQNVGTIGFEAYTCKYNNGFPVKLSLFNAEE